MSTALADHLTRVIARNGPIDVSRYMAEALGHPSLGYYMRKDPFGQAGDFVTAPEISQMFGELIGLWCAEVWRLMGSPAPMLLVELGPGRGTLMSDLLRAVRVVPAFDAAIECHLVETSPLLKDAQRENIARPCFWHASIDTVPRRPMLLIANEFLDAVPVRQFVRTKRGWCERKIDIGVQGEGFRFVLSPEPLRDESIIPSTLRYVPLGSLVELSPERDRFASAIAIRVASRGGAGLIVDYGHCRTAPGDTFQAVRGHCYFDPLSDPGEADLTTHVDFDALARAALQSGGALSGPVEQGAFLRRLGIDRRMKTLSASAGPEREAMIKAGSERLTAPDQMGSLFKVIAIRDPKLPELPGF